MTRPTCERCGASFERRRDSTNWFCSASCAKGVTASARLLAMIEGSLPDVCVEWPGATDNYGYGVLRHNGQITRAPRVAWSAVNGPIPNGLDVLHSCDNPPCFNPRHLSVGTPVDNGRDMMARGRGANQNGPYEAVR